MGLVTDIPIYIYIYTYIFYIHIHSLQDPHFPNLAWSTPQGRSLRPDGQHRCCGAFQPRAARSLQHRRVDAVVTRRCSEVLGAVGDDDDGGLMMGYYVIKSVIHGDLS